MVGVEHEQKGFVYVGVAPGRALFTEVPSSCIPRFSCTLESNGELAVPGRVSGR